MWVGGGGEGASEGEREGWRDGVRGGGREGVMDGGSERWMLLLPLSLLMLFFYAWFRVGSGSNP